MEDPEVWFVARSSRVSCRGNKVKFKEATYKTHKDRNNDQISVLQMSTSLRHPPYQNLQFYLDFIYFVEDVDDVEENSEAVNRSDLSEE